MLDSFGCIAVLASLMLASIGLSDYLEDMLNKINRRGSRPLAIFLTYFPAALASIFVIYLLRPGVPHCRRCIFSQPVTSS
ncbi:aromatic amino acid transport family protein [Klebsiella michiganensis]